MDEKQLNKTTLQEKEGISNKEITNKQAIFNLKKNSKEIYELIETHSNDSVSFYEFVEDINNNFSKDEKLDLIKYLWDIAYADNILDVNEERLIRRISDLIQIKNIEVLKLKNKARN